MTPNIVKSHFPFEYIVHVMMRMESFGQLTFTQASRNLGLVSNMYVETNSTQSSLTPSVSIEFKVQDLQSAY